MWAIRSAHAQTLQIAFQVKKFTLWKVQCYTLKLTLAVHLFFFISFSWTFLCTCDFSQLFGMLLCVCCFFFAFHYYPLNIYWMMLHSEATVKVYQTDWQNTIAFLFCVSIDFTPMQCDVMHFNFSLGCFEIDALFLDFIMLYCIICSVSNANCCHFSCITFRSCIKYHQTNTQTMHFSSSVLACFLWLLLCLYSDLVIVFSFLFFSFDRFCVRMRSSLKGK